MISLELQKSLVYVLGYVACDLQLRASAAVPASAPCRSSTAPCQANKKQQNKAHVRQQLRFRWGGSVQTHLKEHFDARTAVKRPRGYLGHPRPGARPPRRRRLGLAAVEEGDGAVLEGREVQRLPPQLLDDHGAIGQVPPRAVALVHLLQLHRRRVQLAFGAGGRHPRARRRRHEHQVRVVLQAQAALAPPAAVVLVVHGSDDRLCLPQLEAQ